MHSKHWQLKLDIFCFTCLMSTPSVLERKIYQEHFHAIRMHARRRLQLTTFEMQANEDVAVHRTSDRLLESCHPTTFMFFAVLNWEKFVKKVHSLQEQIGCIYRAANSKVNICMEVPLQHNGPFKNPGTEKCVHFMKVSLACS